MLDYDGEADDYDATRGGPARATAAAEAVERLLPAGARTLVDLACGTCIVTTRLRKPGRAIRGVDRSRAMLAKAGSASHSPAPSATRPACPSAPARWTRSCSSGCCTCCQPPHRCSPSAPES